MLGVSVLVCLALLSINLCLGADEFRRDDFPPGFVFGAASSAFQVEGAAEEDGKTPSILDTYAYAGNFHGANGDVACDEYHKYKEDVQLMVDTSLEAYRFSISWSRLIPNGRGPVNPKGLQYYNNLIDELISHGIQPHVTLHHSDLPQALEDEYGGWVSRKIVKDFTAYADVCFEKFGDRVSYWTTMNEANVFVLGGYDVGFLPPSHCSPPFGVNCSRGNSSVEPYIAAHHILLAHASAARLYKQRYQADSDFSMDKDWVFLDRMSDEYLTRLRAFIAHALRVSAFDGHIKCPCSQCCNRYWKSPIEVEEHIFVDGMDEDYVNAPWTSHGEQLPRPNTEATHVQNEDMTGMLHDAFGMHGFEYTAGTNDDTSPPSGPTSAAESFFHAMEDAKVELYPGCGRTKLSFLVRLYQIKCLHSWTNASFTELLTLLKDWFPKGVNLPPSFYKTKKFITDLGLSYEKIDACPKDCMLYWKEHANNTSCHVCGKPRYKENIEAGHVTRTKVANKVLRYFPLGPRLQRLYMSHHTADSMVWHAERRQVDGVLRHPADSPAWEKLDSLDPSFGSEPRNVRLGLASDGFNPFGMMSLSHSTWPVIISVYNLPPWLCMKQPYLMLSLLIPGPKSPGNDIDIYLQPLVEELKTLWEHGLPTFDAVKKETFIMRAAVLWTINDFPAYAMLSGWSTKGKKACPQCAYGTYSLRLNVSQKECYLGHRRWLPINHRFRRLTHSFNGSQEHGLPPIPMTGGECLASLSGLTFQFGKGKKKSLTRKRKHDAAKYDGPWKKKSIFFDLPYWKDLLIRHNLDVMHIEKNVTDSVLGTLLCIDGKNKDTYKARLDLVDLKLKKKLHPILEGGRTKLPPSPFTLSNEEKTSMCTVLASVKVPDGFASNIARCVKVEEKKLIGLKSHDCHILMQYLIPIAIRGILPRNVIRVLLELSSFFRNLCSKVGTTGHFQVLSRRIAITLCELEKLLPPAFFDSMVHLPIHLADEAAIAGPVQYRWMYPIERYLQTLKKYVRNKYRPEGSIAEGYIVEECLTFCSMYLGDETVTRRNRPGRNVDAVGSGARDGLVIFSGPGRSLGRVELFNLDQSKWERAHLHVLLNCPEVQPYIRDHVARERANRGPRISEAASIQLAHLSFPEWFRIHIDDQIDRGVCNLSDDLCALASGPSRRAGRWKKYIMNGYRFHVKSVDEAGQSQNSGVFVQGENGNYAIVEDTNPSSSMVDYYGVLNDIIDLDYHNDRHVVLFDCDWINGQGRQSGIKIDEYGFTLVNFSRLMPPQDTFILGSQAHQVFYVQDLNQPVWHVAVKTRPRDYFDMGIVTTHDISAPQNLDDATNVVDEVEVRTDVEDVMVT